MRKQNGLRWLMVLGLCVLGACSGLQRGPCGHDALTQVSTIDAILAGAYDGQMTIGELKQYGDFGIGTLHGLDGEMVMLDGRVYQVNAAGMVRPQSDSRTTPFAGVVFFEGEMCVPVEDGVGFEALQATLDEAMPDLNRFYAIRVDGHFRHMHTRSVPGQQKPYPPLTEVTRHQPEFQRDDVEGTLVGFRAPAYSKGITVPGYHLHFLSKDREFGGHVLSFETGRVTATIDRSDRFLMILPDDSEGFGGIDLSRDRSKELHQAER